MDNDTINLSQWIEKYINSKDTFAIASYTLDKVGNVDNAKIEKVSCISCSSKTLSKVDSLTESSINGLKSYIWKQPKNEQQLYLQIRFKKE